MSPTTREFWEDLAFDLLSILWPCSCVICDAPDRDLCRDCKADLQAMRHRRRMGQGAIAPRITLPQGVGAFVAGPYAGPLRALLVPFKHGGRIGFGRELGAQLRAPLREALSLNAHTAGGANQLPLLVVSVPSRRARVRERGYRHVDILVRRALREEQRLGDLNARFVAGVLRPLRGRTGQVGLDATSRALNASRVRVAPRFQTFLRGRRVVLVDDVITTGATMHAAAAVLEAAGAEVVAVVALCATERRDAKISQSAESERSELGLARKGVETDPQSAVGFVKGVKVRSTMWPPAFHP